jgi:hypothetical protein
MATCKALKQRRKSSVLFSRLPTSVSNPFFATAEEWIASSLAVLAMTSPRDRDRVGLSSRIYVFKQRKTCVRDLATLFARGLHLRLSLVKNRGRREDRVRAAPAVSRARCTRQKRTRAYRFSGSIPAFPAQWLYGLLRALPGERLSCHRRRRDTSRRLDASTAASGPHDFAVRSSHARQSRLSRPPHPTARS